MRTTEISQGLKVSNLCIGAGPLGGMPTAFGYDVSEERGIATVQAVFDSPINFMDTSSEYGDSEVRIGKVIREGRMPKGFVIATKADAEGDGTARRGDFSAKQVRASFELSLERLGLTHIDVYFLHDPEKFPFEHVMARGGAMEELLRLKDEGLVGLVGVAGGDVVEMARYVDTGNLDILLNYGRYTLLDRSADSLIDKASDAGMAFLNAGPYASGLLAAPRGGSAWYQYAPPNADALQAVDQLHELCESFDVSLRSVALQFSMRDPRITSTVVGLSRPERVRALLDDAAAEIPAELWDQLPAPLNLPWNSLA
ncbi:aldo/keto reductase [Nocardioides sp. LS1]|uniref:aldo/keto reductase n=1 Tax=Nocardioides sp. LS1 TaxID=1027620 RepID=UPI000F626885|nr:aldo/keto reductase [Nocardioides sp. LS1]GCD91110.1 oxidoreductase [Nocardioides sp. LS1]